LLYIGLLLICIMDQSTNNNTTEEEVLVLYGSQTGNSEGAAQEICSLIPTKLSSSSTTTSRVMHLDDFLEVEKAKWTKLVVIVCSSYGVGQAPIGARKFRELCDEILLRCEDKSLNFLNGVHFALLGLGDSHYTTYFQNPTTIHKALTSVGAVHVGELGKADASGTDNMEQSKVIERWINNIWKDLNKVVATTTTVDLDKARDETWGLCLDLFPDWKPTNYASMATLYVPLVGILLAILFHFFYSSE